MIFSINSRILIDFEILLFLEYLAQNNVFYSIYSGLYLNQVPINADTRDDTKISNPTNDVNPSSFAINDNNPIDDIGGHLSRSLLWESNYSSSTGGSYLLARLLIRIPNFKKMSIVEEFVITIFLLHSR